MNKWPNFGAKRCVAGSQLDFTTVYKLSDGGSALFGDFCPLCLQYCNCNSSRSGKGLLIREKTGIFYEYPEKNQDLLNKASNVIQCGYSEITLEINQLPGKGPIFVKTAKKSAEMRDENWAIRDDLLCTPILKRELGTS